MFRLIPWSSALGGNKVMAEDLKMCATSPTGLSNLATAPLKRKRSDSCGLSDKDAPVASKPRPNGTTDNTTSADASPPTVNNSASTAPVATDRPATSRMDVSKLRETIEAQLSLEVLLKHNELRLIDQEIAKCQVALEQLRRCAEIPYPGSNVAGLSQTVSDGTGVAVLPPGNGPAPLSPAPWGVTDGAYTRHYSRWLIPDPRFDGGEPIIPPLTGAGPSLIEGRSTRSHPSDGGVAAKSRPRRGSGGAKFQSLPNGYPPPKEKAGPMLIRRKSDGVLVKLICLDCRRDNFSSTQGFINHCRIAHNRNFASHDAAAVASGEPVEVDDAGTVVGANNATPNGTAGYVHPLIRSAHAMESSPRPVSQEICNGTTTPRKSQEANQLSAAQTPHPPMDVQRNRRVPPGADKTSNDAFTASPATPHLSSLMQVKGIGLDLDQLVGDAKTTVDLEAYSSEGESDDDSTQRPTDISQSERAGARASRQPMRTPVAQTAPQRPSSRKGGAKSRQKPHPLRAPTSQAGSYTSPYAATSSLPRSTRGGSQEADGAYHSVNLSPNTVELNQAPSLVSDDDDYEAAVDSASPCPSSSEAGDRDQELGHINVEDDEGTTSAASADPKTNPELGATHHAGPLTKPLRQGSKKEDELLPSMVPLTQDGDEKHVSFASPKTSPAKGKKGNRRPSQS